MIRPTMAQILSSLLSILQVPIEAILKVTSIGRNVAAVFERLGYNPDAGIKLFGALCEALARKRAQNGRSVSTSAEGQLSTSDSLPPPPVTPTPPTPPRTGQYFLLFA